MINNELKVVYKEALVNDLEVIRRKAAINPNQEGWCPDRNVSQEFLE
jgi:hypothetical protein